MKRILVAVALLVFIAAVCFIGNRAVKSSTEKVGKLLSSASSQAEDGDYEKAAKTAEKAEKAYEKHEHSLFFFIDHSLVESLGEEIGRLPRLATKETKDEFLSQIDAVRIIMTHIERDNRPSLRSVF